MKLPALVRPIFFLVLGLHAAVLLIPLSGSTDELIPAPDPEGEEIAVTRIPPEDAAAGTAVAPVSAPSGVAAQPPQQVAVGGQPQQRQQAAPSGARSTAPQRGSSNRSAGRAANSTANSATNQAAPDNSSETGGSTLPPISDLQTDATSPPPDGDSSAAASGDRSKPLTLAALAANATRELPETLSALVNWFNDAYTYRVADTSTAAETAATQLWLSQLQERTDSPTLSATAVEQPLVIPYPLEEATGYAPGTRGYDRDFVGCLSQDPGPATVGVYFDGAGDLVGDPQLLRSTGYEFLNRAALERAKSFDGLPQARSRAAFTIPVEVTYSAETCLSLAQTP